MNRRKLLTAIGASVFAAVSLFGVQKLPRLEFDNNLVREDNESSPDSIELYPVHENIVTTVFWVGEEADMMTNDNIHNSSSVWVEDWESSFGGVDDPDNRCATYAPCGVELKENPFYFALPFSDYNSEGLKPAAELEVIPWYEGNIEEGKSILKNRWIEIMYLDKKVYAQWEDAGPFGEDDADYVFGIAPPKDSRAGLDVSPAVADYLGIDGRAETSWRFVEESQVPSGPWKIIITSSDPKW